VAAPALPFAFELNPFGIILLVDHIDTFRNRTNARVVGKCMRVAWIAVVLVLAGCGAARRPSAMARGTPFQQRLIAGARDQLSWGTAYDGSYFHISYPDGDPPREKGACTDVVVRAYRSVGIDLQQLIHEDMLKHWDGYPRYAGLKAPDANIDHRRVPNQRAFFHRHGKRLTLSTDQAKAWQPGDIVEWRIWDRCDHTGILTDQLDAEGFPYVLHNMGAGPQEEDVLRTLGWKITGHYRYPAK
jgi:uncharacterized protein YijF (DUF1287 family)